MITLDLEEPQLDLIEPRLIVLGEMQVNLSIGLKKDFDRSAGTSKGLLAMIWIFLPRC
jgi:hypothetical protein